MDTITIKYKVLFNLQLVLEEFDDDLDQYFSIVPDEKTKILLSRYQTLSKKQKSAFTFVTKTEHEGTNDGKPWVSLGDNENFKFQIKLKEAGFIQNTHLADYDFVNQVILVTNATVNMAGNELLITAKLVNYSSANVYPKGYIVKSGTKKYKALQLSDSTDPHGVTDTDYWEPIIHMGISQADLVDRSSLAEPVDLDTIMLIEINSSSALNANYRLLDTKSKVREVSYLIRFQNSN